MKAAEPRSSGPMTAQTDPTGMIMDRIGRSWRSAMRDVFLIVVSILIAFGLDAWWSGRMALEEERLALSAIRADFGAARVELDSVLLLNAADARAITALLSLDQTSIRNLGHDSASAMVLSLNGLHMELQDVDRRLSSILELLAAELGED